MTQPLTTASTASVQRLIPWRVSWIARSRKRTPTASPGRCSVTIPSPRRMSEGHEPFSADWRRGSELVTSKPWYQVYAPPHREDRDAARVAAVQRRAGAREHADP